MKVITKKYTASLLALCIISLCLLIYCMHLNTDQRNLLESTQNTTDRADEIQAMLESGYCHLGPGDFYISGITMPEGACLAGSGNSTQLILLDGEETYAIKLNSYCTVQDLQLLGALEAPPTDKVIGNRHGILFSGNATEDSSDRPLFCQIENCLIRNFSGGGISCFNTGYSLAASINVTDCSMLNCGAGINISYFSEYHQFTNVSVQNCYYGCINNGGNNIFTNCNFGGNTLGFLIDNSNGQSRNNSHGSAISCTFNHSGSSEGGGICVLGAQYGFVFSDCQMFFSPIIVENSNGISFNNCNFGSEETIQINGGTLVLLNGCMFGSAPNLLISDNTNTKLINCYTRDGNLITK